MTSAGRSSGDQLAPLAARSFAKLYDTIPRATLAFELLSPSNSNMESVWQPKRNVPSAVISVLAIGSEERYYTSRSPW